MKQRVLVVDDEAGIRTVLGISLTDMGHDVQFAETGEEAVYMVEKRQPAIILTDIKMPGMDGIGVLQAVKRINPDIEVIMMTGHGDMDLAIESLKLCATDFITKPISTEVLEIAIHRASERISLRKLLREYTENLEQMVLEKSRQLVEAERLAAFGQAVASLSHTIKNIAAGLKGGTFVLEKGIELHHEPYLTQGWNMVRGNVEKLAQLSLDLIHYGKASRISIHPCDPNQPAREVYELLLPQAQSMGIPLELSLSDPSAPIPMDSEAMMQCLHNLVINALDACVPTDDFVPEAPKVVIRTACRPEEPGVEYEVEDTGRGMDENTRNRLFQGFFTTKGGRGTGIGLMTSHNTVANHQGTITCRSESGKGTIFRIFIPAFSATPHG